MPLSEYVVSLDGVGKSRYFDKLKVLGLAATDDPYAPGDFQNTMRLWLPVEFGHIFCLHRAPWSLHTTGAAAMEAARSVQLFQEWIRQDHVGAFQDNAPAAVSEIPHLHGRIFFESRYAHETRIVLLGNRQYVNSLST